MIKYFLFFTFSFVKLSLFAQTGIQQNDSICLVSKPCTNVTNMSGVSSWHYKNGISRDSSIRQRLSESLALRPFEVDEGIEITFSKENMKAILKVLHFKRPFKNYIWRLADCYNFCHYCGTHPIQTLEGKEGIFAGFEVDESNEITITSFTYFYPFRAKGGLHRANKRTDEKSFTKNLLENSTAKSAILGNTSVKARETLLIYYPIIIRKK